MKSRIYACLALCLALDGLPAAAQVMPLGKVPRTGAVRPASCQSCGPMEGTFDGAIAYDGGTVWGTNCFNCNLKPGLFPPCPNPCQTTLLGEMLCDVRTAVDGTLSHVFGCVFGYPCGCRGVCTCAEPACGPCGMDGAYTAEMMPQMGAPRMQSIPQGEDLQSDPFGDDPSPTPAVQPIPKSTTTQSILITPPTTTNTARQVDTARHASYEQPAPAPTLAQHPLRRTTTLRRANGETLERTSTRANGSQPPLRFR